MAKRNQLTSLPFKGLIYRRPITQRNVRPHQIVITSDSTIYVHKFMHDSGGTTPLPITLTAASRHYSSFIVWHRACNMYKDKASRLFMCRCVKLWHLGNLEYTCNKHKLLNSYALGLLVLAMWNMRLAQLLHTTEVFKRLSLRTIPMQPAIMLTL